MHVNMLMMILLMLCQHCIFWTRDGILLVPIVAQGSDVQQENTIYPQPAGSPDLHSMNTKLTFSTYTHHRHNTDTDTYFMEIDQEKWFKWWCFFKNCNIFLCPRNYILNKY